MTKNGYHQFQVFYMHKARWGKGYIYEIYSLDNPPDLVRESEEWFENEAQARLAAIGHISLIENGEG